MTTFKRGDYILTEDFSIDEIRRIGMQMVEDGALIGELDSGYPLKGFQFFGWPVHHNGLYLYDGMGPYSNKLSRSDVEAIMNRHEDQEKAVDIDGDLKGSFRQVRVGGAVEVGDVIMEKSGRLSRVISEASGPDGDNDYSTTNGYINADEVKSITRFVVSKTTYTFTLTLTQGEVDKLKGATAMSEDAQSALKKIVEGIDSAS